MKFKSLPMLAVTIAGTAMMLAACQAQSSPTQEAPGSSAQSSPTQEAPGSSAQAQNTQMPDSPNAPGPDSNDSMQGAHLPPNLNLTDAQKTKIKEIQDNYRSKMKNIFTDEQKNELKAAQEQGSSRKGMKSLNLTDSQKQQIKDLMQSQRQEVDNVLTAEQKQQLQKMRQSRQHRAKSKDGSASQGQ